MTSKIVEVLHENSQLKTENEALRKLLGTARSWWASVDYSPVVVDLQFVSGADVRAWMQQVDDVLEEDTISKALDTLL